MTDVVHHDHHRPEAPDGVIDPVCGMTVDPHTTPHRHPHHDRTYHFCSAGCRTKFAAAPEKYLDKAQRAADAVPEGTIYTCPMHPEIRQIGPGSCPICGMALEPELATADTGPNPELADMSRRFWIGLVLTLPVFGLEMGAHIVGGHGFIDQRTLELDPARACDTRCAVGRLAVLRARMAVPRHAQSQHVHADRDGHRCRLSLQRHRNGGPRHFSGRLPHALGSRSRLLRGGRRHHHTGAARTGARIARARTDLRRDPRADRSCAEDRAPGARWHGRGNPARRRRGRRCLARAPGRKDPR